MVRLTPCLAQQVAGLRISAAAEHPYAGVHEPIRVAARTQCQERPTDRMRADVDAEAMNDYRMTSTVIA